MITRVAGRGHGSGPPAGRGGGDGGPPRLGWEVVDRLIDRVDEPKPIGLEPRQHRWLVRQVNLGVIAVQALGDLAVQVVDAEGGGIEEPAFVGAWVGWGLADEQDLEPVRPVLVPELLNQALTPAAPEGCAKSDVACELPVRADRGSVG